MCFLIFFFIIGFYFDITCTFFLHIAAEAKFPFVFLRQVSLIHFNIIVASGYLKCKVPTTTLKKSNDIDAVGLKILIDQQILESASL